MAEEQASACLNYGVQPSEWRALSRTEKHAFHTEAQRIKDGRR